MPLMGIVSEHSDKFVIDKNLQHDQINITKTWVVGDQGFRSHKKISLFHKNYGLKFSNFTCASKRDPPMAAHHTVKTQLSAWLCLVALRSSMRKNISRASLDQPSLKPQWLGPKTAVWTTPWPCNVCVQLSEEIHQRCFFRGRLRPITSIPVFWLCLSSKAPRQSRNRGEKNGWSQGYLDGRTWSCSSRISWKPVYSYRNAEQSFAVFSPWSTICYVAILY